MKLTPRLGQALTLAIEAHEGQMRKGTNIPYISHPIAVASIALEHGADEDQAIAALLHDAIEDGGANYENRIRVQFGDRVVGIVNGCTDGVPDDSGQKAPWEERKLKYIKHLSEAGEDVLLVSGSDKLHNARSIVEDLISSGQSVFDRFTVSKAQTLWYYESLSKIFEEKGTPIARALKDAVNRMKTLSELS
jgi:(p)ppGpp synthase/HD superfamily hydrolase